MSIELHVHDSQGYCLGIDVGSTTIKTALTKDGKLVHSSYTRHLAQINEVITKELESIAEITGESPIKVAFSGSAGMGLADDSNLPFIQEVYATTELVRTMESDVSVVIELGGEDAKVIFFKGGVDERMNGTCAGGTGAFIDQMSSLLKISIEQLDEYSLKCDRVYTIASRCGVFAKTDLQSLFNQGASLPDLCASIYQSIVNQTIAGLAQGRKIDGRVMFLGGPLTFCPGLRFRFKETLGLKDEDIVFPSYSNISVAIGANIYASKHDVEMTAREISEMIGRIAFKPRATGLRPLFKDSTEYEEFKRRHDSNTVPSRELSEYSGKAYLGIDCGSTTTKLVLINDDCEILYSHYTENGGNPVSVVKEQLQKIYEISDGKVTIESSCVTGYGEDLVCTAFNVGHGLVETLAHYRAAKHFNPDVDYILDIGGQDIKCFRIENGAISNICLNEACSSGCGSFLQTFAKSMGYSIADYAKLGLFSKCPSNLGSRCTVFMNSSVKHALKEGAKVEDISAGLAVSVVKNALYKVIRETDGKNLGKNVVVQGGTFLNDCVLRAFEIELGRDVIRPKIAGLMGAFGCALYAKEHESSKKIVTKEELSDFVHNIEMVQCPGCGNACKLNVNTFANGRTYISGNRCEKGLNMGKPNREMEKIPNLYEFKRKLLREFMRDGKEGPAGTMGLPLSLAMYEFLPYWRPFFEELGFKVIVSNFTTKKMIYEGQYTIPSDTICYPAKVMHGHMLDLISRGADVLFYPSLTYTKNEGGFRSFSCPVEAYYGEVLKSNLDALKGKRFLFPYLNVNNDRQMVKEMHLALKDFGIGKGDIKRAVKVANASYNGFKEQVFAEGERAISEARNNGTYPLVLVGRPYHIDPEICHNIDKLAVQVGFSIISEDAIRRTEDLSDLQVLDQWTYHSRMYNAARRATKDSNMQVMQLNSFSCGIDAVTSDEIKRIVEEKGKLYSLIKIDEHSNQVAMKVRLRSLKGILDEKRVHSD